MKITLAKLEKKIRQARVSYWTAQWLEVAIFDDMPLPIDEWEKLMDKLSRAGAKLEGRLQTLAALYDDLQEETYHAKAKSRMYDSLSKYRALAEKLTEQTEMRVTA